MARLGQTVKRAQLQKIKAQVLSIWDKGCKFDDCVCVCVCVCVVVYLDYLSLAEGESHVIIITIQLV